MPFTTLLAVEEIEGDYRNWLVSDDLVWVGTKEPYPDTFIVEAGEITDFASSPWFTWMILPRIGKWTKAAVLHDKMCNVQKEHYDLLQRRKKLITDFGDWTDAALVELIKPPFSSIDADIIFKNNAREAGTDIVRSELLWMGVRWGALSKHRRENWWHTFPRLAVDTAAALAVLAGAAAAISWAWPW